MDKHFTGTRHHGDVITSGRHPFVLRICRNVLPAFESEGFADIIRHRDLLSLTQIRTSMLVDRVQRLIPSAVAGTPAGKAAKVGTICQTRSTSGSRPTLDSHGGPSRG